MSTSWDQVRDVLVDYLEEQGRPYEAESLRHMDVYVVFELCRDGDLIVRALALEAWSLCTNTFDMKAIVHREFRERVRQSTTATHQAIDIRALILEATSPEAIRAVVPDPKDLLLDDHLAHIEHELGRDKAVFKEDDELTWLKYEPKPALRLDARGWSMAPSKPRYMPVFLRAHRCDFQTLSAREALRAGLGWCPGQWNGFYVFRASPYASLEGAEIRYFTAEGEPDGWTR